MQKEAGEAKTLAEAVENFPQIKDKVVSIGTEGEFVLHRAEEQLAQMFSQTHCIKCRVETPEEEMQRLGRLEADAAELGNLKPELPDWAHSTFSAGKGASWDMSFFRKMSESNK